MERRRLRHSPALRHRQPAHPGAGLRHHFSGGTAHPRIARRVRGTVPAVGHCQFLHHHLQGAAHRAGGSVRPRHCRLGGRWLQPVSHRSPRVLLGAVRRLLRRLGEAVPPTKARSLGRSRQRAGGGPAGVPRHHAVPSHRHQERLQRNRGRMGCARLLRHPGHRALLPLAGPRADAQASGGLLRRGRGRHPGPLRRGSADGNGRHGGRVPLARHNGQPKLSGAHHWRCSTGTARSTPLRRTQRHRHHERDVLRSLRIPRP